MRLRRLLPIGLLVCCMGLTSCGFFNRGGIRVGPNCTSFLGDNEDQSAATRYYFGFDGVASIGDGDFSLQPELNFLGQGAQFKYTDSGAKVRDHLILHYLQLGAVGRWDPIPAEPFGFSVIGGLTFDFGLGGRNKEKVNGNTVFNEKRSFNDLNLRPFNLGLAVGVEGVYNVNDNIQVFSQLRYGFGFIDVAKSDNISTRNSSLPFNVGARVLFN